LLRIIGFIEQSPPPDRESDRWEGESKGVGLFFIQGFANLKKLLPSFDRIYAFYISGFNVTSSTTTLDGILLLLKPFFYNSHFLAL